MLMMVARKWRLLTARTVLSAALLSVLVWLPYGLHEWRHSGSNTQGLMVRSLPAVSGTTNTQLALSWPLRLLTPEIGYHAQKGYWGTYQPWAFLQPNSTQGKAWANVHPSWLWMGLIAGLLVAGLAWLGWLVSLRRRDERDAFAFLLLAGTLLGWLLLLAAGRRAYPHYLHPLIPLYAGAFGLGLSDWFHRPKGKWVLGLLVSLHLASGLVVTTRFQQQNDSPYSLNANLFTLDTLRALGGAEPRFCGALRYRSKAQLQRLAWGRGHNSDRLNGTTTLVHALPEKVPAILKERSLWRAEAHGVVHILMENTLPGGWGRVGCQ
jgi:hypothetical protein